MAFLADVEDVEKQETEKEFRISEDFLGAHILSQEDVTVVYKQRAKAALHNKKLEWRTAQSRQHTGKYSPSSVIKAGTAAATARRVASEVHPQYDTNRNDIWAKRMNSLRLFVTLVSKYLLRKRVTDRMRKVTALFEANNARSRDEVLRFIDEENETNRKQGGGGGAPAPVGEKVVTFAAVGSASDSTLVERPVSVAAMVFATQSDVILNRTRVESVINAANLISRNSSQSELTSDMARRILFPRCIPSGGGGDRKPIEESLRVSALIEFDDRTFFSLKVRPEYVTLGYQPHSVPTVPLYFPLCEQKGLRRGAPEEGALRPPADEGVSAEDIQTMWLSDPVLEPLNFLQLLESSPPVTTAPHTEEEATQGPLWLEDDAHWSAQEINYFQPHSEYRVFVSAPRRCEMDADWPLRPDSELLQYRQDPSIRTSRPGFLSANLYLLGGQESRNNDPPPPPGPTLSDYYLPDGDRHRSGLLCYANDHLRGPVERDRDLAPLQSKQDKADYLTDSESDEEDGYGEVRPSIARVKQILRPPAQKEEVAVPDPKAAKGKAPPPAKKGAPTPAAAPVAVAATPMTSDTQEGFGALEDEQRREEQVELLRDRKTLDLESTWSRARKQQFDAITKRLVEVSGLSQCLVQALPVQMPFHSYEDEVYALMSLPGRMSELSAAHVELDPRASVEALSLAVGSVSPIR
eukprot:gene29722-36814_t